MSKTLNAQNGVSEGVSISPRSSEKIFAEFGNFMNLAPSNL